MNSSYPFLMPQSLDGLVRPDSGRTALVDVRVRGKWDGILAVNDRGECIGVYAERRVQEIPLPFDPAEIEDVRPACKSNRLMAAIPNLWVSSQLLVMVMSPVALAGAVMLHPALGLGTVAASGFGIWLMYQCAGFPLTRLPMALAGIAQIACVLLLWMKS